MPHFVEVDAAIVAIVFISFSALCSIISYKCTTTNHSFVWILSLSLRFYRFICLFVSVYFMLFPFFLFIIFSSSIQLHFRSNSSVHIENVFHIFVVCSCCYCFALFKRIFLMFSFVCCFQHIRTNCIRCAWNSRSFFFSLCHRIQIKHTKKWRKKSSNNNFVRSLYSLAYTSSTWKKKTTATTTPPAEATPDSLFFLYLCSSFSSSVSVCSYAAYDIFLLLLAQFTHEIVSMSNKTGRSVCMFWKRKTKTNSLLVQQSSGW